ncbi:MAG: GMC family oxidoreductase [Ktedonobacterales bacterium]|nr:GMC family oxidoreductase [Ktedonobacterales bacterium]
MATTQERPTQTTTGASWLSPAQLRTLEAVCEALIPAVPPPPGEGDPHGFYARTASDLGVAQLMAEALGQQSSQTQADFKQLLDLLGSPLAGLLLLGRPRSFPRMSLAARQAALRRMSTHALAKMRQGFQGLKRLAAAVFYTATGPDGLNPNWPAIGYTPAPPPPTPEAAPKRIRTLPVAGDLTLTADVVIVGSGAGGGLMAAELAAAGKDVLVLEKGGYYNEADFTGREGEMMRQLFLRRGLLTTADLGMVVQAGSCLGGGTVVNWSTSLRTPPDVLEEWEREHGLTGATSADHQLGFAVAERRLGVTTADSEPNPNNAALQHGCQELGYDWRRIPRNASECWQRCGACGFGCPYGRKQSTMLTFLQDAHDRGARFVVRCTVERVLIEAGRAVGVEGWAPDDATGARRKVMVRAPLVVVAAGSVESPALLLRSGLTNPNIGLHLRLHPVVAVGGLYREPIESWKGSPQTVLSDQFARLRGGYGIRFEVMPAHPGLLALAVPWEDGQDHKRQMARVAHQASLIVLTRDTGEGSITLDKQGDPVIHYWPNALDRAHLTRGLREITRIILSGGGIGVTHLFNPKLTLETENGRPGAVPEAQLQRFLGEIERRGIERNRVLLGTAHQMGTCRFGGAAREAVADPYGEVYGARGLFIADASGFPTASGVNPMLSIYGLAYRVAQRVKAG